MNQFPEIILRVVRQFEIGTIYRKAYSSKFKLTHYDFVNVAT